MKLLFVLVGLLCVVAIAPAVVRQRGPSLSTWLVVASVAIGALAFWSNLFPQTRALIDEHGRDSRLTAEQALALPGTAYRAREDFLAWADARLPRRAAVFLYCPQPAPCSNALANWITYRLQPRVFTDLPTQAQWVLFYATSPSTLRGAPLTWLVPYAPGFALARVGG